MLRDIKDLEGFGISAIGETDAPIGHVRDFLFDDHVWVVRYLVVETGSWLASRKVLIPQNAIGKANWMNKVLPVAVTREQLEHSPDIDRNLSVSRQHEPASRREVDPHLRSCHAVAGYRIHATDGDIGRVASLLFDDETWAILYLVVETGHWWAGHEVLIAPAWITAVGWADASVSVKVTRHAVMEAPAYDPGMPIDRQHEMKLYRHYGRAGYWTDADRLETDIVRT